MKMSNPAESAVCIKAAGSGKTDEGKSALIGQLDCLVSRGGRRH
jgi:hypothetical protein